MLQYWRFVGTKDVLEFSAESRIGDIGGVINWSREEMLVEVPRFYKLGLLTTEDAESLLALANMMAPGKVIEIERVA